MGTTAQEPLRYVVTIASSMKAFDPICAKARHVYLRTEHGEHLTVEVEDG